jgi:hypothetical protein
MMPHRLTNARVPASLILFGLLLAAALTARLWVLQRFSQSALECRWCVVPGTLSADLPYLALLGGLFTLSYAVARRWWSLPWRLLAMLGLVIYLADAAVTGLFATRLSLADLRIYLAQPNVVLGQLDTLPSWQPWLLAAGGIILVALSIHRPTRRLPLPMFGTAGIVWLGVAIAGWITPAPVYVHDWAIRNVMATRFGSGLTEPYSEATREHLQDDIPMIQASCRTGSNTRENIVMLILESWSPYQSHLWSALNDWTPRLDRLARENIRLTRLHASGFNTNEGLVSLLAGMEILLPMTLPSETNSFETAWGRRHTLPRQLAKQDYHRHFITSGNLEFTRKGEWLEDIGFTNIEGHDHPAYDGVKRLHFDSVPDDVLYEHALQAIQSQQELAAPFLTVIENVSSHHPFIHPYTGERDEEAMWRFVDKAAETFIEGLKAQDFFDDGLLVVVSDHRAMSFIAAEETKQLGRAAASRIPAFLMTGEEQPRVIDTLAHQADLPFTLVSRVGEQACGRPWQRDLLSDDMPQAPRCVLHTRGDRRDRVDAFCQDGEGTIAIAGDDSHFLESEGLNKDREEALLERIALQRLEAEKYP